MHDKRMTMLSRAIRAIDTVDDNIYGVRAALGHAYEQTQFDNMPLDEAQIRLQKAILHEFMDNLDLAIMLLDQTLLGEDES